MSTEDEKMTIEGLTATIDALQKKLEHQTRMFQDIVFVLKIFRNAINNESIAHVKEVEYLLQAAAQNR